jgi:hypothetical protein
VVWGKLAVFNALKAGFYRKLLVLRTLEAKFLKQKNLCGLVLGMEPGVTPRVHGENTTLTNRVADCKK